MTPGLGGARAALVAGNPELGPGADQPGHRLVQQAAPTPAARPHNTRAVVHGRDDRYRPWLTPVRA
ncbi:hypothetical protein [Nonomuraea sp. NPDC049480]|uniref:hypothetical protein n=1 Tax=Nonomuraea sp. NPDC049480 TaxID=3364353 RepID=UPI0037988095